MKSEATRILIAAGWSVLLILIRAFELGGSTGAA